MLNFSLLDKQLEERQPFEKRANVTKNLSEASANQNENRLILAMQPIDAESTEKTFANGESVKSQLQIWLPAEYRVNFAYQGSVTNNTHIRIHSDIDLLAFHGGFVLRDGAPQAPGLGINVIDALTRLRASTVSTLKSKFPTYIVDSNPGKSVAVSGPALSSKIDVVNGNWWDTLEYQRTQVLSDRGISILNSKVPETIQNKPFDHNRKIDEKDRQTGGLRKGIRLLKTLKYSSAPQLSISSYDIAALVWNMSVSTLNVDENAYLNLAENIFKELCHFVDNQPVRDAMMVPNGTRKVFVAGGATLDGLKALRDNLQMLLYGLQKEASASAIKGIHRMAYPNLWQEVLPRSVRIHSY